MATKIFIEKAEKKHGNLYDYSEVVYSNAKTKVNIRCKDHGVFEQTPNCHLVGSGCPTCAKIFRADNRRSNIKDFIRKAREVHGEKYDYSLFEYVNAITKGIILCKVSGHGPFEMQPNNHLSGKQCSKCSGCYKPTTEEYIENAKRIHGEKYDYSNTVYIDSLSKIKIICETHGEFQQSAGQHLQGNGCNACVDRGGTQRYDTEMFIEKAKEVHGETYLYTNVKYVNSQTKIIITCREVGHGDFEQNPANHLRGGGCSRCQGNKKKDTEQFIEEASAIHGDKYDYSNVVYMGAHEKVSIFCRTCDREFEQVPTAHTRGMGCFKCAANGRGQLKLSNTDEFIEKSKTVHGENTYDYSDVVYIKSTTPVKIHCKKHGEFEQVAGCHLQGNGCPMCTHKTEGKLYASLKNIYPNTCCQYKREWCKKVFCLPYDFCIPELNVIIELDGPQHFTQVSNWDSPDRQYENDKFKEKCANENGFSVIRLLQEDVFYDTYDWLTELCNSVDDLKKLRDAGNSPRNVYLCKNGEYDYRL